MKAPSSADTYFSKYSGFSLLNKVIVFENVL